jgi:hypothetical protein
MAPTTIALSVRRKNFCPSAKKRPLHRTIMGDRHELHGQGARALGGLDYPAAAGVMSFPSAILCRRANVTRRDLAPMLDQRSARSDRHAGAPQGPTRRSAGKRQGRRQ